MDESSHTTRASILEPAARHGSPPEAAITCLNQITVLGSRELYQFHTDKNKHEASSGLEMANQTKSRIGRHPNFGTSGTGVCLVFIVDISLQNSRDFLNRHSMYNLNLTENSGNLSPAEAGITETNSMKQSSTRMQEARWCTCGSKSDTGGAQPSV
jgi:hypothetical protein